MEFIASRNIKEKRITTNLNYLVNGVVDFAEKGNIRMCVSLDGHTKDLHENIRGKSTFDITIQNILFLLKNEIDVEIIHTVNALSYDYILELINFLKKIGIKKLNLYKLSLKGNALNNQDLNISPTMWRKLIEKLQEYSTLGHDQVLTVRHEVGYATVQEYKILKTQVIIHILWVVPILIMDTE